jgi:hypothetical protein
MISQDTMRPALRILSCHAFGGDPWEVELELLDERIAALAQDLSRAGMRLRQVGRAARCDGEVRSTVRFEKVPVDSLRPLEGRVECP